MNEYFFLLTPERVLEAVEEAGYSPSGHCLALNSLENRVYDIRLEDGKHVVAKFYRPGRWSAEQILEEHRFLFELRDEEIPVCAPVPFPDGQTLHQIEGINFAVWPRTGGRAPDEPSDDELGILGRLLARIHNVGAARPSAHRLRLTAETYALRPLAYLEENDMLPPHCAARYRAVVEETARVYETLAADVPVHRIHGDCHLGNLLNGNEGWHFLDFDDHLTGPAVQDVWMLMTARDEEGLRQRETFLEAYRQFRDFDPSWLRLIEPLRALRYIHYAAWIARRRDDPAFPAAFPHYGTDEYWEKETSDLEEQAALFGRENPELMPVGERGERTEEPELTNKDFFWDWEER